METDSSLEDAMNRGILDPKDSDDDASKCDGNGEEPFPLLPPPSSDEPLASIKAFRIPKKKKNVDLDKSNSPFRRKNESQSPILRRDSKIQKEASGKGLNLTDFIKCRSFQDDSKDNPRSSAAFLEVTSPVGDKDFHGFTEKDVEKSSPRKVALDGELDKMEGNNKNNNIKKNKNISLSGLLKQVGKKTAPPPTDMEKFKAEAKILKNAAKKRPVPGGSKNRGKRMIDGISSDEDQNAAGVDKNKKVKTSSAFDVEEMLKIEMGKFSNDAKSMTVVRMSSVFAIICNSFLFCYFFAE